ncbi:MAG: dTDP-4-dehydrorhamnose 3,5-epimerase [Bacteroidota bacterium]|nr:dTDP-4-dehydrorhamnose 3,5-epimerase [Bacteroidota bacterium]
MRIQKTTIKDLLIIEPQYFEDERGYFFESYNKRKFYEMGLNYNFVQDNQSYSQFGVIRALHYQLNPHSQAKLVRVLKGKILDVAVDLRKGSPSFGKTFSVILSNENKKQLLIPAGFAHGFSVLSNEAVVFYKCDKYYEKEFERGIIYNDKTLDIDWAIEAGESIVSQKDRGLAVFEKAEMNFE